MARKLLWASLALAPVTFLVDFVLHADAVVLFVLAAASLIPLAWLIGESTEHAAEHTGPGIGGFLNASFGNAPEVIIALFAVADGLPDVVRGSLAGSVVSNLLLVLGVSLLVGKEDQVDRPSLLGHLGLVFLAVLLFLVPSIPGLDADPERRSLAWLTLPVAVVLLSLYLATTVASLRRHKRLHVESGAGAGIGAWSLPLALSTLAIATGATALVSEILVHSLEEFAEAANLSRFFIATVIVAIVGNAAEHGGAVVIARRGKMRLASEIAISSGSQVALLVTAAVALLSWVVTPPLPLTFRPVELATMGGAALLVAVGVADGKTRRWEGALLVAAYIGAATIFFVAGER